MKLRTPVSALVKRSPVSRAPVNDSAPERLLEVRRETEPANDRAAATLLRLSRRKAPTKASVAARVLAVRRVIAPAKPTPAVMVFLVADVRAPVKDSVPDSGWEKLVAVANGPIQPALDSAMESMRWWELTEES